MKRKININIRNHYSVYVILLTDEVGPRKNKKYPCIYVGMTGLSVKRRFQNHKNGIKSSKWAKKYGNKLLPYLYEGLENLSYYEALFEEKKLAEKLNTIGYTVYGVKLSL